ncbi:hypothetical protein F2Q68_00004745 [Brassica cretica]|uniref:Uncharacterized protein n=1 Tax=Brassica cretica TaxID=69181 RepID=A0A8S9JGX2_BRACR|nr:hypothetical protein F2Q68_00004745 [Brassica cretica]
MSLDQGTSESALSSCFDPESSRIRGDEAVLEIEFVAHYVDPYEADVYWVATCNMEMPPPELWCPPRPFAEIIAGRPIRNTYPFHYTVRSFFQVQTDVVFHLPREGEKADVPPCGYFTLYEANLVPSPSCRNILGYEWGVDLTADYLESLFSLTRTKVEHLYDFKLRSHMVVVKGLTTNDRGWKDYFFFVRLDEASVAEESLLSLGDHREQERVHAEVALCQSQSGPSTKEDAEPSVEDPISSGFQAHVQSGSLGYYGAAHDPSRP